MKKDVIINVYSCSAAAPCHTWAESFFTDPPLIINVPANQFRPKAIQWSKTGDAFAAALKEYFPTLKNVEVGRRGLTTFSLGWIFTDELLKFKKERDRLDAYLLLDGCHTSLLDCWVDLGIRAANGDAFMAMAHSSIKPPFISTTISNTRIFDQSEAAQTKPVEAAEIPDYILDAKLPPQGVTISLGGSGNLPPISKTWKKDPLIAHNSAGNLIQLHYSGNDRPDHVYIAWHVSKRLWQFLGERWSKQEGPVIDDPPAPDIEKPDPKPEPDLPDNNNTEPDKQINKFLALIMTILSFLKNLFK